MRIRNLFMMAAAASMAFTACNNDEIINNGDNPNIEDGKETCAVFDIQISQSGAQTKAVTPEAGDENAIQNESKIENAGIYIFKYTSETSGVSEVKKDGLTATLIPGTDEWHIPAQAVMLTSGKKHVIVVTNMSDDLKGKLATAFSTTYEAFNQTLIDLGGNAPESYSISRLFLTDNTAPSITMSGENDPVLEAGVTESQASQEGNSNHVKVFVDRLPAKIDVKLAGMVTEMQVPTGATKVVGASKNFSYDARNMNRKENVMKSITGTFVNTPWSAATDWTNDPFAPVYASRFYPVVSETSTFPGDLLTAAGQENSTDYRKYVTYMSENTNETSRKGTTSYIAMKASYVPVAECYVSGYTNDAGNNNVVKLTPETLPSPFTAGQFSMFNYDYNIAFKAEANKADAFKADYVKALVAYHAAQKENALKDIKPETIQIIDPAVITDYDNTKSISDPVNKTALAKATATRGENTLWVSISNTLNANGDLEQMMITAGYYWDPEQDGSFILNEGVDFGSLTCGVYTTDEAGLLCYYRVNIFDEDLGVTNMMRYSVVRNYSYHMTIDKINSIGYPTQIDLVVDPDEPLNNNTFVQAHVVINKWTSKDMNTEIGM